MATIFISMPLKCESPFSSAAPTFELHKTHKNVTEMKTSAHHPTNDSRVVRTGITASPAVRKSARTHAGAGLHKANPAGNTKPVCTPENTSADSAICQSEVMNPLLPAAGLSRNGISPFSWKGQSSAFVKEAYFRNGSGTGMKKEQKLTTHDWRINGPQSIATPEKVKTKPGVGRNASA